jgi:NADH-quinone oxidoreductase subunit G
MAKMVNLTIDGTAVSVPEGMLVVDAARKTGIDIPVFCYHPKMEPVGMCRMCLVDIGKPVIDRASGQPVFEADGKPKISFGAKLETACTTPVSEGMVVLTASDKVKTGRKEIIEFILTSHPLDCPICDKGGECPLQNLTLAHGPAQSRFALDEKMHLKKHVPLGELIWLDRERCIQCGRCVRFQEKIAGDPVIGFFHRGRSLEIITCSEPGFDSYFSGNTTDICPVGALTSADFRFGARPWELKVDASICSHCPVGCNLTFNIRREAKSGGKSIIKRVMPRQNEQVNELWICDKGRFAYQFTESPDRVSQPMMRVDGQLRAVSWDEALGMAAHAMKENGQGLVTLAGGRLANEDLFNLKQLTAALGGKAVLQSPMGGGDLVARYGLSDGSNLGSLGKGDCILVVACDIEEEAPIWWLRLRQAALRGAALIVLNPRPTRADQNAMFALPYPYGGEAAAVSAFLPEAKDVPAAYAEAVKTFAAAQNGVVFYGSDGLGLAESSALAQVCADVLVKTGHTGRSNNGLVGVWSNANTQGAWELGFAPNPDLAQKLAAASVVYVAAADPAGDDPLLARALAGRRGLLVVQELFLTETAKLADVVLPAQAFTEREGTYTSGERRVQRFYQAVTPLANTRTDFAITAALGNLADAALEGRAASLVFERLVKSISAFQACSYAALSQVQEQWPMVGRKDLYFGGTGYENTRGLGMHLAITDIVMVTPPEVVKPVVDQGMLLVVPATRLYDRSVTMLPSVLLHHRMEKQVLYMHPELVERHGLIAGDMVSLVLGGKAGAVEIVADETIPAGVALLPRSVGLPIQGPAAGLIEPLVPTGQQFIDDLPEAAETDPKQTK